MAQKEDMTKVDVNVLQQLIQEVEEAKISCNDAMKHTLTKLFELLGESANLTSITRVTDKPKSKSDDTFALLYIVCVLLFFAASLVVVLIKYLMRERDSTRLETFYNNYLEKQPTRKVLYDHQGKRLSDTDIEKWEEEDGLHDVKESPSTKEVNDIPNNHFSLMM